LLEFKIFDRLEPTMIFNKTTANNSQIDEMFQVGAHFGFDRSRRHPSTKQYIFGKKENIEIFDLEKVDEKLTQVLEFVKKTASEGKQILFVGGKKEAVKIVRDGAERINMPFVAGRWIGGTLTNFSEIRKRINYFLDLNAKKSKGELVKYKKKERLMIEREIINLEERFGGISDMTTKPSAVFIVDPSKESIARDESNQENIPVIGLAANDNDLSKIDFPIPANDSSVKSIKYFVDKVVEAYKEGSKNKSSVASK
jgi:small subunit ribosomal protein S2